PDADRGCARGFGGWTLDQDERRGGDGGRERDEDRAPDDRARDRGKESLWLVHAGRRWRRDAASRGKHRARGPCVAWRRRSRRHTACAVATGGRAIRTLSCAVGNTVRDR